MIDREAESDDGSEPRIAISEKELRQCLRRADFEFTEEYFLHVLRTPRNKMNTYWAILALGQIGTDKSIPALKEALLSRRVDTAMVAMTSLSYVAGKKATHTYTDALTGTWYRHKWSALYALQRTCDPLSFPKVSEWVKKKRREIKTG